MRKSNYSKKHQNDNKKSSLIQFSKFQTLSKQKVCHKIAFQCRTNLKYLNPFISSLHRCPLVELFQQFTTSGSIGIKLCRSTSFTQLIGLNNVGFTECFALFGKF